MKTVSAVVCAYTELRWEMVARALDSLHRQTIASNEILLVIDHNTRLFERARAAFPEILVIENSASKGLSGARNSGVAKASGDVVAFLDDDAWAAPDWLERLLQHYDDDAVLGVGGLVRARWPSERPWWFPSEFDWVVGCSYTGLPDQVSEIRNPIGAGMSFRREIFDTVGGFDSSVGRVGMLPVGCEETELAIRARRRWPARTVLFEPAAVVDHEVPPARTQVRYFVSRCWSEGVSKSIVARIAGRQAALASERSYVLKTIPRGLQRETASAVRHADPRAVARAVMLVVGTLVTAAGYAQARVRPRRRPPGRKGEA